MRQRHHHRSLAETVADTLLQRTRAEDARDRHLADQDQCLRPQQPQLGVEPVGAVSDSTRGRWDVPGVLPVAAREAADRKSTRLNSSHLGISYAVFCLK